MLNKKHCQGWLILHLNLCSLRTVLLPSRFETAALPVVTPESSPLCISVPALRVAVLRPFPVPVPAPRVRVARVPLVPAPIPKPAEPSSVPGPLPVHWVGTADAQPLPVPVPRERATVTQLAPPHIGSGWRQICPGTHAGFWGEASQDTVELHTRTSPWSGSSWCTVGASTHSCVRRTQPASGHVILLAPKSFFLAAQK